MPEIIYRGNVRVYLQGTDALLPNNSTNCKHMTYYIGSKKSKIIIRDHRDEPIWAAQHVLAGLNDINFADVFNQPAYAEVKLSDKPEKLQNIEIDLHFSEDKEESPVLWMGVLENRRIPPYEIEWEFLRPINHKQIAFAILAK